MVLQKKNLYILKFDASFCFSSKIKRLDLQTAKNSHPKNGMVNESGSVFQDDRFKMMVYDLTEKIPICTN